MFSYAYSDDSSTPSNDGESEECSSFSDSDATMIDDGESLMIGMECETRMGQELHATNTTDDSAQCTLLSTIPELGSLENNKAV